MKKALIFLSPGFEEIEAMSVIDILRRAEVNVTVAGLVEGPIVSAHGVSCNADTTVSQVIDQQFDVVILPGGEPGSSHLDASKDVKTIIQTHADQHKLIAAICAAPKVLNNMGLLDGKKAI